uniref:Secreted protein n=1 Tax=Anguilla anguilla TaxID=7936 RepID=A0A0E9QLQ6_ANGAN
MASPRTFSRTALVFLIGQFVLWNRIPFHTWEQTQNKHKQKHSSLYYRAMPCPSNDLQGQICICYRSGPDSARLFHQL